MALLLLAGSWACQRVPPPGNGPGGPIQVLSVRPAYRSDGKAEITLLMSVDNGHAQPGEVKSVRWRLSLRRRRFAEGEQLVNQKLLPQAATRFELVLPIALRKAPAAAELAPVELSILGDLTVVIGGAEQTLPFAKTAVVEAPRRPHGISDED
ncbi:MAG TPA: hypothetical protein VKE49_00950 [Myxococcaceae bacterium]|nr:hypothetical protein [Myxococcaceae bacterium]